MSWRMDRTQAEGTVAGGGNSGREMMVICSPVNTLVGRDQACHVDSFDFTVNVALERFFKIRLHTIYKHGVTKCLFPVM